MKQWLQDQSFSAFLSGMIAVLVGVASSIALIFQAGNSLGLASGEMTSWIFSLCLGLGALSFGLSWFYKMPVLLAWSTPGAALLITALVGVQPSHAIGAFCFSAALITILGVTGWFAKLMNKIPVNLAAAMLAGVLVNFGIKVFSNMQSQLWLCGLMFITYLLAKRFVARYAILLVLLVSIIAAIHWQLFSLPSWQWQWPTLQWTAPQWHWPTILSVGLPLFLVTMASQNLPGIAVFRAQGFQAPVSPIITSSGLVNLVIAPFGGFAINLAAITAAICMSSEAHPEPSKRYVAAMWAGLGYLLVGLTASVVVMVFIALPAELVLSLAGLALFTTIGNSLFQALQDEKWREPALITFMVTASGLTLWGIGSAFWGMMAGGLSALLLSAKR